MSHASPNISVQVQLARKSWWKHVGGGRQCEVAIVYGVVGDICIISYVLQYGSTGGNDGILGGVLHEVGLQAVL